MNKNIVAVGVGAVVGVLIGAVAFGGIQPFGGDVIGSDDCKHGGGTKYCVAEIDIKVTGRCPDPTNPAEVEVKPTGLELNGKTKTILLWKFSNADWAFCPTRGHGVWFSKTGHTQTDGQFDRNWATDQSDGDRPNAVVDCYPYFRMRDLNERKSHTKKYEYTIEYGNPAGTLKCTIDPFIKNG